MGWEAIGQFPASSLPLGGLTGQVLTKASGDDLDVAWSTPAAGGLFGGIIDGGGATTTYLGVPSFDFGSAA